MTLGFGFDAERREITFRMTDKGVPFDPLKKPDPDITLSAEDREIGGLGIFITKKTMDQVTYAYENNKNILTMIKKI
jgi:anti-sigma regulatory factor (Ser/Thr protein kinase)